MYVAGVDSGALTTKAVILGDGKVLSHEIMLTGMGGKAYEVVEMALSKADLSTDDLAFVVATGYGRINVPFAAKQVTEITCHGRGAHFLIPTARMIIDVGGQDSKVIRLNDQGNVIDFAMNDKCAAGSGRFLEVMAHALEIDLEEMGKLSLISKKTVEISSTCTVFAESEVISHIASGIPKEDIIAGIHRAIASRVAGLFFSKVRRKVEQDSVVMTGGVAKNIGMIKSLEEEIGIRIIVPPKPQIVGALGAALIAQEECFM